MAARYRRKEDTETIMIYPPGSPVIVPGERVDADIVEYIQKAAHVGLEVLGRGCRSGERELKIHCVDYS
ncbi:MAG TPA: hypothetical protein GXX30_00495 [Firmicutes bacterium]|nr:hypothetical protein [Candidatus Fermentithermobacillaceae bacterium]